MGAYVVAYWPGITEEQMETMPGFWNDDRAWGNWMAERDEGPKVLEAALLHGSAGWCWRLGGVGGAPLS
jgi:uncharacterized membrane protein